MNFRCFKSMYNMRKKKKSGKLVNLVLFSLKYLSKNMHICKGVPVAFPA